MKMAFFNHPRVRQLLTLLFLAGAVACIFPPATPFFQWWAAHSLGVALGYVGLGLFFLALDKSRLMFVCLGCGAAISFSCHEKAAQSLLPPKTSLLSPDWEIFIDAPGYLPFSGDTAGIIRYKRTGSEDSCLVLTRAE